MTTHPTHTVTPPRAGRLRAAWTAAHAPVAGAPRWARVAAYGIPFLVLPSSVWRIVTVVFLAPDGAGAEGGALPSWLPVEVYVCLLSLVSEAVAFTAVGLVATWGEVFPRWLPLVGGRRVPVPGAVVPAALGAVALTALWTVAAVSEARGVTLTGEPLPSDFPTMGSALGASVFYASYAPLLLWGPLLGALTVAYWRRRRRT
ncbi:hypothetical protein ACH4OW_26530 [Streptomyces sp. NPDC017056]|uniref:hypothetical protein n=1 Tax=Streptomyces sp. NPDC017056 TaxID=3364973 RepID=UPI003799D0A9